jgi:hypothetical protein
MRMKPLLAVAGVALLGIAGGVVYIAVPSSEEEVLQEVQTATPTPSGVPASTATPTSLSTLTPGPTGTAPPSPTPSSEWLTYVDAQLGFSLRYPPDLVLTDLTGPSPVAGLNERVFQFRSPSQPTRSFSISISSNPTGLTPEQWLLGKAACLPKTMAQGSVDGQAAASCTSRPEEIPEAAMAFEHMAKIVFITSVMPAFGFESEFEAVMASLRLSASSPTPTAEPSPEAIPAD